MNKLINISMTIGILLFIGLEICKNVLLIIKTKTFSTWKQLF